MTNRFLVATRKGLFTFQHGASRVSPWSITSTAFLGDNVSMVLEDPRDGTIWAALDHGHLPAGHGEIVGAGRPDHAAADHNDLPIAHPRVPLIWPLAA